MKCESCMIQLKNVLKKMGKVILTTSYGGLE